ncbi:shikimate dehydrogenase [Acidothermaceae bacterium B102]|nr:shikimate dehydrogenase [Acidothermaceae bacterium B102]
MTRAAVLGYPIAHSLSPALHRAAYAALGLDWTYEAIECDESGLAPLLASLLADGDWAGFSLTMPLKAQALAVADHAAASATQVGVANTLVVTDGSTTAHNTDVAGVRHALAELGVVEGPSAPWVLGGGGTSRAVLAALADLGSRHVTVAVRREAAARELQTLGQDLGLVVAAAPWPGSYRDLDAADLVIATTPAGATDPLAATGWRGDLALLDVLYAPWPTGLAAAAEAVGAPVVGGLPMLVGQAVEQVALMTGRPGPVAAMRAAGEAALAARTKHA